MQFKHKIYGENVFISKNEQLEVYNRKEPCSVTRGLNVSINPLPDNKILDWSKLKQIADDILKCI